MMQKTVTRSGRPRSDNENDFTRALTVELNREQDRRSMDQRAFAHFLGVHESLLSLYRSGQRFPSVPGFIELEEKLPGLLLRVVKRYYKIAKEEGEVEQQRRRESEGIAALVGAVGPPANRGGGD